MNWCCLLNLIILLNEEQETTSIYSIYYLTCWWKNYKMNWLWKIYYFSRFEQFLIWNIWRQVKIITNAGNRIKLNKTKSCCHMSFHPFTNVISLNILNQCVWPIAFNMCYSKVNMFFFKSLFFYLPWNCNCLY